MKYIKYILLLFVILFLVVLNILLFAVNSAPSKIGLKLNTEKTVKINVPVAAEISGDDIAMTQKGLFPSLTFNAVKKGKASVALKLFGITLKTIDVTAVSDTLVVPSGQIVGLEDSRNNLQAGTITFYNKETGSYAALAHGLNAREDEYSIDSKIYYAETGKIVKDENGSLGSLSGNIYINRPCGSLKRSTNYGIYGTVYDNFVKSGYVPTPIALSDEVHTGSATFVSDVEGTGVNDYNCEVVGFENGYFIINITDEFLIEKTGGVVHGMSGTPVIQDNKIIGAIRGGETTDPTKIYCIYIQDMMADYENTLK